MRRVIFTGFVRIVCSAIALFVAYSALLCFPQPLFFYTVRANNLVLHSDRPLSSAAATGVLQLAAGKLAASPLYSSATEQNIYVCNSPWRQRLFFNKDYGAGGVAPYPITSNVFLREARIEDNRLISPRGIPVPGARTLDYFIAHEITHQLTGRALGPYRYFRLPQWVREGYADYVGKGSQFDFSEARKAFLKEAVEMDWKRSGLYWRFHLLAAYSLDHRHLGVAELLRNPPDEEELERALRQEKDD